MTHSEPRVRRYRRRMSTGVVVALVVGGAVLAGCASDGNNTAPTRTTTTNQESAPGSAEGMQLVTDDIEGARAELAGLGAPVSEVFHDTGGVFHHGGTAARASGAAQERQSYGSWVSFGDPDGNLWFVQEVTTRLPGRAVSALAAYDSVAGLADALRRAAAAHGKHEEEIGQADPDWPDWYAQYMAGESVRRTEGT